MTENKATYSTEYQENDNGRQRIVVTDSNSPDYMLTFDQLVCKGYDTESENNKKESISIYKYPLCLYVAYKQILRHSDNPKIRYISDIQRYSTLLGHAILEQSTWYQQIEEQYNLATESENDITQDMLDNTKSYTFVTSCRVNRRAIKTLFFIKESLETKSNILGINSTDLILLCSLLGLETTPMKKKWKDNIRKECTFFKNNYIPFIQNMYSSYSLNQ